jgi:hypothetical protein
MTEVRELLEPAGEEQQTPLVNDGWPYVFCRVPWQGRLCAQRAPQERTATPLVRGVVPLARIA